MLKHTRAPVLGIAAFSGTGKTTLMTRLIGLLAAQGLRVATVKHAHHSFDIDKPGKDSYELRKAGAVQTLAVSRKRWALITETEVEQPLHRMLAQLDSSSLDVILVEGFKRLPIPKIELHRPSLGHPLLCRDDESVIAVASDDAISVRAGLPVLDLNRPGDIADFVQTWLKAQASGDGGTFDGAATGTARAAARRSYD